MPVDWAQRTEIELTREMFRSQFRKLVAANLIAMVTILLVGFLLKA